jgi:hypothetical protein
LLPELRAQHRPPALTSKEICAILAAGSGVGSAGQGALPYVDKRETAALTTGVMQEVRFQRWLVSDRRQLLFVMPGAEYSRPACTSFAATVAETMKGLPATTVISILLGLRDTDGTGGTVEDLLREAIIKLLLRRFLDLTGWFGRLPLSIEAHRQKLFDRDVEYLANFFRHLVSVSVNTIVLIVDDFATLEYNTNPNSMYSFMTILSQIVRQDDGRGSFKALFAGADKDSPAAAGMSDEDVIRLGAQAWRSSSQSELSEKQMAHQLDRVYRKEYGS